jgi:hypothetical protein
MDRPAKEIAAEQTAVGGAPELHEHVGDGVGVGFSASGNEAAAAAC